MRLILSGNHGTSEGDSYPFAKPFEYKSKEQFLLDVWDGKIDMFAKFGYTPYEVETYLEYDLETLEEWYKNNETQI